VYVPVNTKLGVHMPVVGLQSGAVQIDTGGVLMAVVALAAIFVVWFKDHRNGRRRNIPSRGGSNNASIEPKRQGAREWSPWISPMTISCLAAALAVCAVVVGFRSHHDYFVPVMQDVPLGTIVLYVGQEVPHKYLPCDGRLLKTHDTPEYTDLAKILNGRFDPTGGEAVYLPNLMNRFPMGVDPLDVGRSGKASTLSHTHKASFSYEGETESGGRHRHRLVNGGGLPLYMEWGKKDHGGGGYSAVDAHGAGDFRADDDAMSSHLHRFGIKKEPVNIDSGEFPHEVRPAWLGVVYIIRALR